MTASPTAVPPAEETTPGLRGRFARLYGAKPWHLLVLLGCFAVTGYAVSRLLDDLPALLRIAIWFVGAAVVWDLLLGPAFALADRVLRRPLGGVRPRGVPVLNYLRVPALLSVLLLLVWAPLILQRSEFVFRLKAGLLQDPYLERWLAVSGALFAVSALAYGVALLRAGRRGGPPAPASDSAPGPGDAPRSEATPQPSPPRV